MMLCDASVTIARYARAGQDELSIRHSRRGAIAVWLPDPDGNTLKAARG